MLICFDMLATVARPLFYRFCKLVLMQIIEIRCESLCFGLQGRTRVQACVSVCVCVCVCVFACIILLHTHVCVHFFVHVY
jgi:hypothetical protein